MFDRDCLQRYCRTASFQPGDVMRVKGQHYKDMYLIVDGSVAVDVGRGSAPPKSRGSGSPIGEIGFLRGTPANATVTASAATTALVLDDAVLAILEREQPALTSQLLQTLAAIAEDRANDNLTFAGGATAALKSSAIEIQLCRTAEMLQAARRLRYEIYCEELGRDSPYADHEKRVLADTLDDVGHVFVAIEGHEIVGTERINLASEGPLGVLEELYGMNLSPHHPQATAIVTKFMVTKQRRRSPAALKLIGAGARFCAHHHVEEAYIDCIPALLPYYKALNFKVVGTRFMHRENGPSQPMMLDVARHGRRLGREFGIWQYLRLYAVAKAIRWADRLRGNRD